MSVVFGTMQRKSTGNGETYCFCTIPDVADQQNYHASWWSFYDEESIRERFWNLQPGDVVLDVGAAFGSYALPAIAQGAIAHAFNPCQFDWEVLEKNVSVNPGFAEKFHHHREAIGADGKWFNAKLSQFSDDERVGEDWVKTVSLDSWVADHPEISRVDHVKLDIEGAELVALEGAHKTLLRFKPHVLVENHEFHHPGIANAVKSLMESLGYECDGPHEYHSVSHSSFRFAQSKIR